LAPRGYWCSWDAEVGVVIVIVCVAVFCILAAGIGLVRLWRLHADAAVNFLNLNKQKGRTKAGRRIRGAILSFSSARARYCKEKHENTIVIMC